MSLLATRRRIAEETYADEHSTVVKLDFSPVLSTTQRRDTVAQAKRLVEACRQDKQGKGTLDAFLEEFGLSNKEGIALMCLAEALLRVPDASTADKLISEKINVGDWAIHRGRSDSLLVNASTWGLMLTGSVIDLHPEYESEPRGLVKGLISKLGEPVVRAATLQAMRIMGGQYVLGRDIEEAVKRGRKQNAEGTFFSFDMLGEGARTFEDAKRYFRAYSTAIDSVGALTDTKDPRKNDGVSVKLSALHPRYEYAQRKTLERELYPQIKALCIKAASHDIALTIDAEESERLEISLDIFEALARDGELTDWRGLGIVVQAYQKRAMYVVKWLVELAQETGRVFPVRLVKGAYWDSEIKRAQELGVSEYPVFTRKANTDLSYLHCAAKMLKHPEAIFPQFATHNAYTAAAIIEMADDVAFEFQRLHGMGQVLYSQLKAVLDTRHIPVRVYAPVGSHKDLLPYLVRRLLENGANSSFVNRFLDAESPIDELIQDVYDQVDGSFPHQHKGIPRPPSIFSGVSDNRQNARGIDLELSFHEANLSARAFDDNRIQRRVGSIVDGQTVADGSIRVSSPADRTISLGWVSEADRETALRALSSANNAQLAWAEVPVSQRAAVLLNAANLLEGSYSELVGMLCIEAGRTVNDAVDEVREAIDFCRYYATQADTLFSKTHNLQPLGTVLCISPWNFPLAIFVGQVVAALATGNSVIAKPAEQTPFIAYRAVELLHKAGVPTAVLQLLIGDGPTIGTALISDDRIAGVVFTGSTDVARLLYQQLAVREGPQVPLIAETGGQNCMIVDSTALPEQLVDDVIDSAFSSAGQRCSALRVLYLQEEIADEVIAMLRGALSARNIGLPWDLSTDIGPVIDDGAKQKLDRHVRVMKERAKELGALSIDAAQAQGSYVAPHIFEIDSLDQLAGEVFGPVLHVIRYQTDEVDRVISAINRTGFGLTLGVHSRIDGFARYIYDNTVAGNTYVNRNMIGAVVGVNPFGGTGLSGTGPKAGGPHYLYRFCRPTSEAGLASIEAQAVSELMSERGELLSALQNHATDPVRSVFSGLLHISESRLHQVQRLPGPTGELNTLTTVPRGNLVIVASKSADADSVLAAVGLAVAAGCGITLIDRPQQREERAYLDEHKTLFERARLYVDRRNQSQLASVLNATSTKAVILVGFEDVPVEVSDLLAQKPGLLTPIISLANALALGDEEACFSYALQLVTERTFTDNIVAKGGNADLLTLAD